MAPVTGWTYNDCVNWGGCLFGSHALSLAQTLYNSDQTVLQTDGTTFFDQMDRPVIVNKKPFAGTPYDRNEVRYDQFGRVLQRAMPVHLLCCRDGLSVLERQQL